jgi:type III secretion protein O
VKLDVVRQLQRVKMLHADRAEQEERARRAALDAAVAGVETAREALAAWREEMPRRLAAIYDAVIGRIVTLEELDACKARALELRAHEAVLAQRVTEAEAAAKKALEALQAARARLDAARRAVTKFDDLVATLRASALAEAERKEDSELEEAAETGHRGRAEDAEDGDGWSEAA